MLCLSYYCLCLLFNKIGEKAKQFVPGSKGEIRVKREGAGDSEEKWPKQCMYI
jgi:hypothetical protein